LIYLTDVEFEFFKSLREEFLRKISAKYSRKLRESKKGSAESPVERRSLANRHDGKAEFKYETIYVLERTRESVRWSWIRVKEYYRQITFEERYEDLVKRIKV